MDWDGVTIRDVGEARKRNFRTICFTKGYTIREALMWVIDQINTGKLRLPEKKGGK